MRVGPYQVIETAYVGAFSVVHRARDRRLPRDVAVKSPRPGGIAPALARRHAMREARLRAVVAHPCVLPICGLLRAGEVPLLIGPWLAGGSLRDLGSSPISAAQVLALAEGLGGVLDALHAAGWWHGDVSPGNVLFHRRPDAGGAPCQPVLTDFGTARRIGAPGAFRGSLVGTPHVTAPEVWTGRPVDGRADLYSLGALLYHALTGEWPFDEADPAAFADLHRAAEVPRPSDRTPGAGRAVDGVILRALAKAPDSRFSTGFELAAALRDAMLVDRLRPADSPRARARSARPDAGGQAGGSRAIGREAIAAAGERLERFAESLDEREQAALRLLLRRSAAAAANARAWNEIDRIAMQVLAPGAALVALEECGAAAALAAGHQTPADVAGACAAPVRPISRLLELLAAVGLLAREGDRYLLPPGAAAVYASDERARPLHDAAAFWAHLSRWAATGEPITHMDGTDGGAYVKACMRLGILAAPAAHELAEALVARGRLPPQGRVLDVGAGSGVWSFALAAAAPGVSVTALDRPRVLEETRVRARTAGLLDRFQELAGDWRNVPLPAGGFDVALLGNICHLEPPQDVLRLFLRVQGAVHPGGVAVVIDTMPEPGSTALGPLLQDLHLALRTPGGGVYDRARYAAWLSEAGLDTLEVVPLRSTGGSLTALVALCQKPSGGPAE